MSDLGRASARRLCRGAVAGLALLTLVTGTVPARAVDDEDHDEPDHERAFEALRRGEARALADVLAQASKDVPGQVLAVELEDEAGTLVYEFKILQAGGQIMVVCYDARLGSRRDCDRREQD